MIAVAEGALIFLVGASIGSFLNVCIARWPQGESVVRPRSRCPRCGRPIGAVENIPVVSWLLLRGRCRGCRERISVMYPAVEILVGLGWLGAFLVFGWSFTALRLAVLFSILFGIAVTDARHYVIPDGFTVFGLIWALVTAAVGLFLGDDPLFAPFLDAVLGACVGAGAIAIAGWLGEFFLKREAMGFGDVTLMAVVGAALGPWRALLTIFVGAFLGAIAFIGIVYPIVWLRSRRTNAAFEPPLVPFGVFLAPAALLTLLWGTAAIEWYRATLLQ